MRCTIWRFVVAGALLAALEIPVQLAAQEKTEPDHPHQYHHYQLIDVGTFGGPNSFLWAPGLFRPGVLNNQGTMAGAADTSAVDPYCLDYPDCYALNSYQLRDGVTTDLGVLPGGIDSQVSWISGNGLMAGASDNGQQDPLNPALPQIHAVLWDHGQMTDLGTLPEGGYSTGSWAATVNNRGEVVGQAYNTIPDPNSLFGYGYQSRAFYWKNGVMQDLGTLGTGTDAMAGLINERGQVVGWSYTSLNLNLDNLCFGNALTTGSFIWDKTSGMRDIGNLGGSSCTVAHDLTNHGQIVGGSDIPVVETQHPFVWDSATGMTDLGTPDGGYGVANALNEQGDVVGLGEANGGPLHAILWRKIAGKWQMIDLGAMGSDCGFAESINDSRQVVGIAGSSAGNGNCDTAFFSDDGGPMVDLNTLVPPNSGIQLTEAVQINDRGEIAVSAVDAVGNIHAVLLIPCDENHPGVGGCDYSIVDAETAAAQNPTRPHVASSMQLMPRSRRNGRYQMPRAQSQGR
jgi:probable HAF family extracellular repeat protein